MKSAAFNALWLWLLPGLIAGVLFLGIALIAGTLTTTTWAMPDAIAHTVGMAAPTGYRFALVPVIVGITIHLGVSIGLGAAFAALALWLQLQGWRLFIAGVIFIGCETPVAIWGILHPLLPTTTFQYYLGALPLWGSVLGHLLYTVMLSLLLVLHAPPDATPGVASKRRQAV